MGLRCQSSVGERASHRQRGISNAALWQEEEEEEAKKVDIKERVSESERKKTCETESGSSAHTSGGGGCCTVAVSKSLSLSLAPSFARCTEMQFPSSLVVVLHCAIVNGR